jgi:4-amino-4-deoxy-L-arabinose transferase-like glycosyltransferase
VLRIGYWVYRRTIRGGDWGGYSEACTVWATDPVGILSAHKGIFYAGFSFPFCQVLTLPGLTVDSWVMMQILLSSVACVIVYRTGRLLMNRTAGVVAGFGLVVLWDTWLWTTLLYSTAMMTFAMVCCLWAFARYHHSGSWRAKLLLLLSFGFLFVSHPMGPPIVLGWILYDIKPEFAAASRRILKHRIIPAVAGLSSCALLAYAAYRYWLPSRWYQGEVIYNDPTYAIPVEEAPTLVGFLITNHIYAIAIPIARVLFYLFHFCLDTLRRRLSSISLRIHRCS